MSNLDNLPGVTLQHTDGAHHAPDILSIDDGDGLSDISSIDGELDTGQPGPSRRATESLLRDLDSPRHRPKRILVSYCNHHLFLVMMPEKSSE